MKPSRSLSGYEARFHWKSCGPGVTYAATVKGKEEEATATISAEAFEAGSSFLCPRPKRAEPRRVWNVRHQAPSSAIRWIFYLVIHDP